MGVFKKRGIWWIDYRVDKKRRREPVGSSLKLAREVLVKRRAEIAEGRFFPERLQANKTFAEVAEIWWDQHAQHKKSGPSMRRRIDRLKEFFGATNLSAITPLMVQKFRNEIKTKASVATANRYHAILRSIIYKAIEWELFFGKNPAAVTKLEKEPRGRLRWLTEAEISRLLLASSDRIRPLIVFAVATGMRRGEILRLRWDDIDWGNRVIFVGETKSGLPRQVPLSASLGRVLQALEQSSVLVFSIPVITVRREFDAACRKAGVTKFRFHDLRHTFASHFIMKTGDLPSLQAILGHSTPLMTQRYAHLSRNHLRRGMEMLDEAVLAKMGTNTGTKFLDSADEVKLLQ